MIYQDIQALYFAVATDLIPSIMVSMENFTLVEKLSIEKSLMCSLHENPHSPTVLLQIYIEIQNHSPKLEAPFTPSRLQKKTFHNFEVLD